MYRFMKIGWAKKPEVAMELVKKDVRYTVKMSEMELTHISVLLFNNVIRAAQDNYLHPKYDLFVSSVLGTESAQLYLHGLGAILDDNIRSRDYLERAIRAIYLRRTHEKKMVVRQSRKKSK